MNNSYEKIVAEVLRESLEYDAGKYDRHEAIREVISTSKYTLYVDEAWQLIAYIRTYKEELYNNAMAMWQELRARGETLDDMILSASYCILIESCEKALEESTH